MLLFVDDRPLEGDLSGLNEHFKFALIDGLLSQIYGINNKLITVHVSGEGYRVHEVDTDSRKDMIYDLDDRRAMLSLLEKDPSDVCIYTRRIIVFSDDFMEIMRYHNDDGTGITALVKEGLSESDLRPVFIDTRMRLDYNDDSSIIRSRLMDVGFYIIDKSIMVDLLKRPDGILGLDQEEMISISQIKAFKGYRVKTRIGFLNDLESILETQRIVMDWMMQGKEKTSFGVMSQMNMIVNMPSYIHKSVRIGENCRLGPYTTLMKNVKVGKNAYILNSVICENSVIGDDVYIEGSIIKPGSTVKEGSEVEWRIA